MPGISKPLLPYIWYYEAKARFFAHSKRSKLSSALRKLSTLRFLASSGTKRDSVDENVYSIFDPKDDSMRSFTYIMFDRL